MKNKYMPPFLFVHWLITFAQAIVPTFHTNLPINGRFRYSQVGLTFEIQYNRHLKKLPGEARSRCARW